MKTITLVGSTRFADEFKLCLHLLTLQGISAIGYGGYGGPWEDPRDSDVQAEILDMVHFEKISRADAVLVIDCRIGDHEATEVPSYIGVSTARSILWASTQGVVVAFLSDLLAGHTSIEAAMKELPEYVGGLDIQALELEVATTILDRALGHQHVVAAQTDTARDAMHAALSSIADLGANDALDEAVVTAKGVLNDLGLVVMGPEQRNHLLRLIDSASEAPREPAIG